MATLTLKAVDWVGFNGWWQWGEYGADHIHR